MFFKFAEIRKNMYLFVLQNNKFKKENSYVLNKSKVGKYIFFFVENSDKFWISVIAIIYGNDVFYW